MNKSGTSTRGRGRPAIYVGEVAEKIKQAITSTDKGNGANLSQARNLLNARNGVVGISKVERELAVQRAALGFTKPLGISQPTLTTLAKKLGLTVRSVGRPAFEVETTPETAPEVAVAA